MVRWWHPVPAVLLGLGLFVVIYMLSQRERRICIDKCVAADLGTALQCEVLLCR